MSRKLVSIIAGISFLLPVVAGATLQQMSKYAIIVSDSTLADLEWAEVVDALVTRYDGQVFTYDGSIWETQSDVAEFRPDYIAFVCRIAEASPSFVQTVWPFTRELDGDPYGDAIWGVVTGCDAADALRIVTGPTHLEIKTVLGGTSCCDARYFPQGMGTSEGTYGSYHIKFPDSINPVSYTDGPTDRTEWLVNMIDGDSLLFGDTVDIFVTSGHGSCNNWHLHYGSPDYEGDFRSCSDGYLYGDPYSGANIPIVSPHPKIYFGLGNCYIGQIFGAHCMAPAWIRNGGAYLYTGYVIPEGSNSHQHGGTKAYFCRQAHFSWQQAFFLANQALLFDVTNSTPGTNPPDLNGSALYGDPALDARIPEGQSYVYDTLLCSDTLIVHEGVNRDTITYKITMNKDGRPGYNGKWGNRHPAMLLPFRVDSVEIISTDAYQTVITDNFVMLYIWYQGKPDFTRGTERYVTFVAKRVETGIEEEPFTPQHVIVKMSQNYPNPFRERTVISYQLSVIGNKSVKPITDHRSPITLKIYDLSGRLVRTLECINRVDAVTRSQHSIVWDGRDERGVPVGTGIYFYRLAIRPVGEAHAGLGTSDFSKTRKMIRIQ